jgi:hypothetical protein
LFLFFCSLKGAYDREAMMGHFRARTPQPFARKAPQLAMGFPIGKPPLARLFA